MQVTRASSKSKSGGSGGSSNPVSIHPGSQKCKKEFFGTRISMCVTKKVRHHDQDERATDGTMLRNVKYILPILQGRFRNQMEREFTDEDWLHCLHLENFKTKFEICKDENGELRHIRAIQSIQVG